MKKNSAIDYASKHITELSEEEMFRMMVGFAKLHVKLALKAASECGDEIGSHYDKEDILNAYPSSNIKIE